MHVPCNAQSDASANTLTILDENYKTKMKVYVHTLSNIVVYMHDKHYQYGLYTLLIRTHFVFKP